MVSNLRQIVFKSIDSNPRNMFDLMRAVALFIPEGHELAKVAKSCFESMLFSPPENYEYHFRRFMGEMAYQFSELDVLNGPWWLKVVCILCSGGNGPGEELYERLNADFEVRVEVEGG